MASYIITESENEISMALSAVMDLTMAEDLRLGFLDGLHKGKNIKITAADVTRITTPCLQVLLAMKNKTTEQNINFSIAEMSDAFQNALKDVGLDDPFITPEQSI